MARHGYVFEKESERCVSSQVYAIDRRMRMMMATHPAHESEIRHMKVKNMCAIRLSCSGATRRAIAKTAKRIQFRLGYNAVSSWLLCGGGYRICFHVLLRLVCCIIRIHWTCNLTILPSTFMETWTQERSAASAAEIAAALCRRDDLFHFTQL